MQLSMAKVTLCAGLLMASITPSSALPVTPSLPSLSTPDLVVPVANGCGGGRYRGPGGACHRYGTGPFPGGYNGPYGHSYPVNHGCGAGRYRGPYGSCHKFGTGPYPGGYYGPYY